MVDGRSTALGVFNIFVRNLHVVLAPGEAVLAHSREPHAIRRSNLQRVIQVPRKDGRVVVGVFNLNQFLH